MSKEIWQEPLAAYGLRETQVKPFGNGHINDTFRITSGAKKYILQRISSAAFPHPEQVMENISSVAAYLTKQVLAEGGDPDREVQQVLPTVDGANCFRDAGGETWRLLSFVEGKTAEKNGDANLFRESARAFGRFQYRLRDYPAETLYETIPHFHDTVDRFRQFAQAVKEDRMGRLSGVRQEVQFALDREQDCQVVVSAQQRGELPLRVTHNDTKIDNVLFDSQTGEGICVIDLDTTMPGLSVNDFGDSIRYGANHSPEDEQDLSKVNFDPELYKSYAQGYLEGTNHSLTPAEIRYLPWGARLMTLECGMRFLGDYLNGDVYFHTKYDTHNLVRCRTQFKLVSDIEACFPELEKISESYL